MTTRDLAIRVPADRRFAGRWVRSLRRGHQGALAEGVTHLRVTQDAVRGTGWRWLRFPLRRGQP